MKVLEREPHLNFKGSGCNLSFLPSHIIHLFRRESRCRTYGFTEMCGFRVSRHVAFGTHCVRPPWKWSWHKRRIDSSGTPTSKLRRQSWTAFSLGDSRVPNSRTIILDTLIRWHARKSRQPVVSNMSFAFLKECFLYLKMEWIISLITCSFTCMTRVLEYNEIELLFNYYFLL